MEKAIFTNMEVQNLNFHKTKNDEEYATFSITSAKPKRNGLFFKGYCQAFGAMASEIRRLKVSNASMVDMTCEFSPYKKTKGNETTYEMGYVVKDISFSEGIRERKGAENASPEKEEENQKKADFYRLASFLNGPNVFA